MRGPFEWVATYWMPEIEYRDYPANEVEDIVWESTMTGSKRGFLVGFPAGALVIGFILGGVETTGFYSPATFAPAPRPGQEDAPALQAVRQEVNTLREENQALKTQVMAAKAVATCPPCQPQAVGKDQPRAHAVAPPPPPAKQATTKATAQRKASGTGPADRAFLSPVLGKGPPKQERVGLLSDAAF